MATVEGVKGLIEKLQKMRAAAQRNERAVVSVGYTQAYAVYVHEDLEAKHKPGKTAKYLETPLRQMQQEFPRICKEMIMAGKTLAQALLVCGLRLQRESQLIIPIDTSALKNSAFTRLEVGDPGDEAAAGEGA